MRSKLCLHFLSHSREVHQGGTIALIQAKLRYGMNYRSLWACTPPLIQLKRTQAHVFVLGLLMASQKNRIALLDTLHGKEVPIETTPQEVLSLMGVEGSSHLLFTFSDEDLLPEGATHTRPL